MGLFPTPSWAKQNRAFPDRTGLFPTAGEMRKQTDIVIIVVFDMLRTHMYNRRLLHAPATNFRTGTGSSDVISVQNPPSIFVTDVLSVQNPPSIVVSDVLSV